MANPEHVKILEQGVAVWNKWREENPGVAPDFINATIRGGNFYKVDLHNADLTKADLNTADLGAANFTKANLHGVDLIGANLRGSILKEANLFGVDFTGTDLRFTDLRGADINIAQFRDTYLEGSNFEDARAGITLFSNVDLSQASCLDKVVHELPSTLGIDTIYKSKGKIPESFLRGCGVPEDFIKLIPSLTSQPFNFYSCFISYSSQDDDFARRLHADLQSNAVRVWFAPEDLKIGDRIRDRIDQSILFHDKLLLILTEQSIQSDWVEKEVETAFEKERKNPGKTVLFPIRLDGAVMDTDKAWAADIRRARNIGDFTDWKNHDSYKEAFDRLLRDLKASEE